MGSEKIVGRYWVDIAVIFTPGCIGRGAGCMAGTKMICSSGEMSLRDFGSRERNCENCYYNVTHKYKNARLRNALKKMRTKKYSKEKSRPHFSKSTLRE